uniref:pyruvate carboxylase n=1 Tax=Ditylum brightwellii TaxID=49249 RepID=A0A7S1YT05_9STRA|mmetsp:Transcript_17134/g.25445  ORF Transcript_17134/g.25445 Transcript_17134/m.25445 type:complete len:1255 (+) Transcript_17134:124-3888(+)
MIPSCALVALLAAAASISDGTAAFQANVRPINAFLHTKNSSFKQPLSSRWMSAEVEEDVASEKATESSADFVPSSGKGRDPPFGTIMAANRAEIAVRIMRAATEMNMKSVGIYDHEDRYSQHRWGADAAYELTREPSATPISSYLDIEQIVKIAKEGGVEAIHPGYGFLSESPEFAQACEDAGIVFVGPTVENLNTFSDKTSARTAAIEAGVPVVPGSDGALKNAEEVTSFVETIGFPVIIKAAMGGGGKGMRVVYKEEDLVPAFESASSEALAAFGDGSVFIERFVDRPRHIEVQIIGDGTGNVVHLWERDCSVQRRHQKVVEMAPAWSLPDNLRADLHEYAKRLTSAAKYKNAGTVEFLIDSENRAYFIEVNPRIQVEHTVTEEVTGIDIVQTQLRIASGATLEEIGLIQENIQPRGVAIQCRVTTENPEKDFAPDTGTMGVFRHSAGNGVRVDGIGYTGLKITPYFDSLIVKYTARGATFKEASARMKRVLQECRIRGVSTNLMFLLNVMTHPEFETGIVTTSFIDDHPELKKTSLSTWQFASDDQSSPRNIFRVEKIMRYLANLRVNGHPPELGADPTKIRPVQEKKAGQSSKIFIPPPSQVIVPTTVDGKKGMRHILLEGGPEAFASAVRDHQGMLITDTTWRDAHQSLLATRMRTQELVNCAPYTNAALANAFSLEMWGGATFDVAMRFLRECPWERLETLREATPDIPFQMLLRGANAVGYTNYPDNVVHKFCKQAKESGVDIFRVFDSLNYVENLKLGIDAAGTAGGFVEGAMSYTGDVSDPTKGKYNLEYYLNLARELVDSGVHSIAIKDMAGLLTPKAASLLVGALRQEHPSVPIHVHTHDTAGAGVAAMIAAAQAGADVVDASIDGMSGLTAQPSLGAVVASLRGTEHDTGIDLSAIGPLNTYWENVRSLYAPFESGQLSGSSDVYQHEIPGGQYTNLLFQSKQLGLTDRWTDIKKKYAEANIILGDIPKVTPSSKVVGDLAQFMVAQDLDASKITEQADTLAFPESVVQYLRGEIGIPPGGFPEPLRSKVLAGRGLEPVEGRPGASLKPYDFDEARELLSKKYGEISDKDVLSHALYPDVYVGWKEFESIYGDVGMIPTDLFLNPMKEGDEVELQVKKDKTFLVKLVSVQNVQDDGTRIVTFQLNGELWKVPVTDHSAVESTGAGREKAGSKDGAVGTPMPGVIVAVKVKAGDKVKEGESVATLSAMKMETNIPATKSGVVSRVVVNVGDNVEGDDLLIEIE